MLSVYFLIGILIVLFIGIALAGIGTCKWFNDDRGGACALAGAVMLVIAIPTSISLYKKLEDVDKHNADQIRLQQR